MPTEILIPGTLELVLAGTLLILIIGSLSGYFLFLRRLKIMQQTILQMQLAQASTQTAVEVTRQETQRSVQNLEVQYQTVQALMTTWQKDTAQLSRALRTTYQQGLWGEHELERIIELAGMVDHCDYERQVRFPNGQRPDLIIRMHNNRSIIVDSKAPSQIYLEAMSAPDETARVAKLKTYARKVREIMNELARKEYWKQLQPTLTLVILFLPNEAMFRAALEYDLGLLDMAAEKGVLLASPVTLIALLKAIAYGWSQEDRAQHVQQIVDLSKELQKELETWLSQWQDLKKAIQSTSSQFSQVTERYNNHILPRIKELSTLDSTLLIKEKAFELKPLDNPLNVQEEETNSSKTLKEEREEVSWQDKITKPLKILRELLSLDTLNQEKGEA